MENNVVVDEKKQTAVATITPMDLLNQAVSQGADMDKLEKFMSLNERWEQSEAKKAFDLSMARFQSSLGPIPKTKQGHNCLYADIDDIAKAVRAPLGQENLSYRFEQRQEGVTITVICIVTHAMGHSERTDITANADGSGGKNPIQAIASAVTYLRRYSLTGALGITTGGEDDDGGRPSVTADDLIEYNNVVREEFFSIYAVKKSLLDGDFSSAKESWGEIDQNEQRIIWKAPSKGGILTTIERGQMKSNEWASA